MAEQILVDFAGEGSGTAELSWGQLLMWDAAVKQNSSLPLGGAVALPPGITMDDLIKLVRYVMSRHQSLRTTLSPGPDGRLQQVLADSGQIAIEVVDTDADGSDPAEAAEALRVRYCHAEVDYARDWPLRVGVVCRHGQPTHLVAIYCHVATDGYGLELLTADLSTMDPESGEPTVPLSGSPPLEQARWQRSPAGQRQNAGAMAYFERVLRSIPADRFGDIGDERHPRHWQLVYTSPALPAAIAAVAARTDLDTAPVLLGAFAVALAWVTGRDPSAAQVMVSNRFRRELAGVVSTVSQPSLCVIDTRGVAFDEVVRRAWRASMASYKHAYHSSRDREALADRIGAERGEKIGTACYFNDRRIRSRQSTPPAPSSAPSELHWRPPVHDSRERLFVHINDVADCIEIEISADTRYVGPAAMEALARTMETVILAAVTPAAAADEVNPAIEPAAEVVDPTVDVAVGAGGHTDGRSPAIE